MNERPLGSRSIAWLPQLLAGILPGGLQKYQSHFTLARFALRSESLGGPSLTSQPFSRSR
jgi:hypothetical protein